MYLWWSWSLKLPITIPNQEEVHTSHNATVLTSGWPCHAGPRSPSTEVNPPAPTAKPGSYQKRERDCAVRFLADDLALLREVAARWRAVISAAVFWRGPHNCGFVFRLHGEAGGAEWNVPDLWSRRAHPSSELPPRLLGSHQRKRQIKAAIHFHKDVLTADAVTLHIYIFMLFCLCLEALHAHAVALWKSISAEALREVQQTQMVHLLPLQRHNGAVKEDKKRVTLKQLYALHPYGSAWEQRTYPPA